MPRTWRACVMMRACSSMRALPALASRLLRLSWRSSGASALCCAAGAPPAASSAPPAHRTSHPSRCGSWGGLASSRGAAAGRPEERSGDGVSACHSPGQAWWPSSRCCKVPSCMCWQNQYDCDGQSYLHCVVACVPAHTWAGECSSRIPINAQACII